jgi:DHA2 family multidrug resistance protein-like MFS transporter
MTDIKARAGRKEWIGLAVLVLPCLLISMDISVLFFALPFISADLAPSGTQQLWIMDIYGFVLAGMLITMGALGDKIGRRLLLMLGATAFGVASVIAAYSRSAEVLIGTRALLGLAGATLMPSTLALVRNMFHDNGQRKTAVAVWTGAMTAGATLGPIVGGLLLNHFWWGSAFLINVPAMVLLLILGPILLPEFKAPKSGRFDFLSALLSLGAVLAVIYGIKQMAVHGFELPPIVSVVAGLLLGFAFIRRQQTHENPLIDLKLFRRKAFSASILVNIIATFAFIGITLFTNQYMQLVLGLRPLEAALWSLIVMPVIFIAMTICSILAKTVRPAFILGGGLILMAAGFGVLTQTHADSKLWVVLTAAGTVAAGLLVSTMLTADMILTAAPPERAGAASALSETANEFGGALGMALLGTIGAAVYHRQMVGAVPAGVPDEAAKAAADTLGGANVVAGSTPGDAGTTLLHAARLAFTHGMNLTATAGAGLLVVAAIVVTVMLRKLKVDEAVAPPKDPADEAVEPVAAEV